MFRPGALKTALLYAGSVIGAGFASGQEILQFFGVHGSMAIWGVCLATLLFAYLGAVIQVTAVRLRAANYREVLNHLLGGFLARVMDLFSLGMLVAGLGVMLAGSGAVFQEQFGLPTAGGVLVLACMVSIVIYTGLNGLVAVNAVLVPVKIALVSGVCLLALILGDGETGNIIEQAASGRGALDNWLLSALLYVSYNMIVPVAVLSSLGRYLSRDQALLGAVSGGLVLGAAAGLVTLAVVAFYPAASLYQLPVLFLAGLLHPAVRTLISVVIWLAVFTTAIANAHGFASRLALPGTRGYRMAGIGITLAVIPLAFADFATLIGLLYPLFGYGGLILVAALVVRPLSRVLTNLHEKSV